MGRGIYVESMIRSPVEEVWERTQDPGQHQRWDLRFSEITYLPRPDEGAPQRFRYATRIGFGLAIEGTGETVATHEKEGVRTSSLTFGSEDPKSLIRDGSGYWRYIPVEGGTRFMTWYDYRVRFGALGRLADMVFRPLIGWATALSFDRLRLWAEKGVRPEDSLRNWWIHLVSRVSLAVLFLYQGIVPKLLFRHPDELALLRAGGIPPSWAEEVLTSLGVAEALFGALLLVAWRWRWPVALLVPGMVLVTVGVAVTAPGFLVSAFNAVALNLSVLALAAVCLFASRDLPSARNCRRAPAGGAA